MALAWIEFRPAMSGLWWGRFGARLGTPLGGGSLRLGCPRRHDDLIFADALLQ